MEHVHEDEDPVQSWLIWGIVALSTLVLMALVILSWANFRPRRHHIGTLTACKSNLKNIGTALEMYSTDFSGKYPPNLTFLTPNYLKTLPECPTAGKITYRDYYGRFAPGNTKGYEDYYYLECYGQNHTNFSVTGNYPAYNGIEGLIERAP